MSGPIRLGIFGWPVEHSQSPEMHLAAAAALGLELEYLRFGVPPEKLSQAVEEKHRLGVDGYNVTVPHKEAMLALLEEVAPEARAIGAVNTVTRQGGRYIGHNTDARGLVRSLREADVALRNSRVVILGAGGAARAAVVGLAAVKAEEIAVLARRPEQAGALVDALESVLPCALEAGAICEADRYFSKANLVIQATSATLESNPQALQFASGLPFELLSSEATVLDMVYRPLRTAVLAHAEAQGCRTVDGLGMLLHQGALAFEMWTGIRPPLRVMRDALLSRKPLLSQDS